MRLRRMWLRGTFDAAQHAIGVLLRTRQGHGAARALLRRAPRPATRLEALVLNGLLFEIIAEGPASNAAAAQRTTRRALRTLVPRRPEADRELEQAVDSVAQRIINHHTESLSAAALARTVAMRPEMLRQRFVRRFGCGLRDFQARVRVCRAIHLFATETRDVLAVARMVGYRSEKNFYRAVRRLTGLTPAQLRDALWDCRWDRCSRVDRRLPGHRRACRVTAA